MYNNIQTDSIPTSKYAGERVGNGIIGIKEVRSKFNLVTYYENGKLLQNADINMNKEFVDQCVFMKTSRGLKSIDDLVELLKYNYNYDRIAKDIRKNRFTGSIELIEKSVNYNNNINIIDIDKLVKKLKKIPNLSIRVTQIYVNGRIVLCRTLGEKGIEYFIYKDTTNLGNYEIDKVRLEDIIKHKEKYSNIQIDKDNIRIVGLDGEYVYNIDKLYDEYKSRELHTKKSIKHRVLGHDVREIYNAGGELVELYSDQEEVVIPDNVTHINKHSIILNGKNLVLKFGKNLEYVDENCIDIYRGISYKNITQVHLKCKESVRKQILKVSILTGYSTDLVYYEEPSADEIESILFNGLGKIKLENRASISNEVAIEFFNNALKNRLKVDILDKEIGCNKRKTQGRLLYYVDSKYLLFKHALSGFKVKLDNISRYMSKEVLKGIYEEIKGIENKMRFRERELSKKYGKEIIEIDISL